jgi:hypothetical protein
VHGTYAKTANKRLSYCRWRWLLPRTPQMPKRGVLAFGITPKPATHELQPTTGTTSPRVTPWEFAGVVWEVACSSEKPEWAHDTAKTEISGGNGTWDAAGGHLNGTWPPRVARSYPPFVTQRNLLNEATRKSQYVPKRKAYLLLLPCCALDEGFQVAFGSGHVMWSDTTVM